MILHGNALDVLKSLPTHSVDSIVTDPPAGINFMGKDWDNPASLIEIKDSAGNIIDYFPTRSRKGSRKDAPNANGFAGGINEIDHSTAGRDAFISFIRDIFIEARRVLKPGGHALVWSLPRTSHWTGYALEEAGFEVRDSINHIFGSGMPKSHNISKAIDKLKGAERKVVGYQHVKDIRRNVAADKAAGIMHGQGKFVTGASSAPIQYYDAPITEPASLEAQEYAGYGTGLKPAHETWWLVRAPLGEKTIAENVITYGTGAINIDASRVKTLEVKPKDKIGDSTGYGASFSAARSTGSGANNTGGRWPSNILLSHSIFCKPRGLKEIPGNGKKADSASNSTKYTYGHYNERSLISHTQDNGKETVEDWECIDGCPVQELNSQSGNLTSGARKHTVGEAAPGSVFNFERAKESEYPASSGGASRYFQTFGEYECSDDCPIQELNKQSGLSQGHKSETSDNRMFANNAIYGRGLPGERTPDNSYGDSGGAARFFQNLEPARIAEALIEEWECIPECPIFQVNQQSGVTQSGGHVRHNSAGKQGYGIDNPEFETTGPTDKGGAARYFQNFYYCAKPSVKERNMGCGDLEEKQGFDKNTSKLIRRTNVETGAIEEFEYVPSAKKNNHPTVKSIALMSYLIKMITPAGGTVLDMFGGSGTTGLACIQNGFNYILIEREKEYIDIIAARLAYMEASQG